MPLTAKQRRLGQVGAWTVTALLLAGTLPACGVEDERPIEAANGGLQLAAAEAPLQVAQAQGGESAFGAYLAGLHADRSRDLSAAADFLLTAWEADPGNTALLSSTFQLVAADGRFDKAVELGRRLAEAVPDHPSVGMVLLIAAAEKGRYDEAEAWLEKLPNRGVNTLLGPVLGAWLAVAQDKPELAFQRLDALSATQGFAVMQKLHEALIYDFTGRTAEAATTYQSLIDESDGPTLRLVLLVGNFFERNGEAARAEALYAKAEEENPDTLLLAQAFARIKSGEKPRASVTSVKDGLAEALFSVASLLGQERADDLALTHVHLALHLRPDFEVAQVLLAEILQTQGRSEEAIEIYRKVEKTSPFAFMAGLRIAEELQVLERDDEAVAQLETLSSDFPERFEGPFRLGNLLRAKERFTECVDAYDRAAERLGTPMPSHWTLFYFRGICLERSDQWPRAEADFHKALSLEPEQPYVMNYLAYSWVEKKLNLDEAKKMLARAVELRPEDGYIIDSLGWAHYRLGEYAEAVQYLEKAVEQRPQDPVINDHLGDALWQVGRKREARFQWHRALSLKPEEKEIPLIEQKIEQGLPEQPKNI